MEFNVELDSEEMFEFGMTATKTKLIFIITV
jgi:hypothetical protein